MSNNPKMITQDVADYYKIARNTLEVWRCKHKGPRYSKIGTRVLYDPDDVEAFFAARSISTRDTELDSARARK